LTRLPETKQLRQPERGFTLLEVIVAVTIVAIMAVGMWAVMSISLRSWSKGTEFIDTNQRHRSILDLTRKQIASAYNLLVPPLDTTSGSATSTSGSATYPFFNGAETSFQFISLNSLQFQESPGLTLVTYEVAQGSQGGISLLEKEARYLGQLTDTGSSTIATDRTTPILENLISCSFEYFDPGDNENPSGWVTEWDAQESGKLPSAVSMKFASRDPKGNVMNRQMIVPLAASNSRLVPRGLRGMM
jgi:prepilin-type N-terminal cleavage/methylation domain-containing protein